MYEGMAIHFFHPVAMGLTILLCCYVLSMGVQRVRATLLGHKVSFPWQRHTLLGKLVMIGFLGGLLVGTMIVTKIWFSTPGITGAHFAGALLVFPLVLFGYATGTIMDRRRRKRRVLPILHGLGNILLLLLALLQAWTGYHVLQDFVLF